MSDGAVTSVIEPNRQRLGDRRAGVAGHPCGPAPRGGLTQRPAHLVDLADGPARAAQGAAVRAARGRSGQLGLQRLSRHDAYAMVRRRALAAVVVAKIGS